MRRIWNGRHLILPVLASVGTLLAPASAHAATTPHEVPQQVPPALQEISYRSEQLVTPRARYVAWPGMRSVFVARLALDGSTPSLRRFPNPTGTGSIFLETDGAGGAIAMWETSSERQRILRFAPDGSLVYDTQFAEPDDMYSDWYPSIVADASGAVFVVGSTYQTDGAAVVSIRIAPDGTAGTPQELDHVAQPSAAFCAGHPGLARPRGRAYASLDGVFGSAAGTYAVWKIGQLPNFPIRPAEPTGTSPMAAKAARRCGGLTHKVVRLGADGAADGTPTEVGTGSASIAQVAADETGDVHFLFAAGRPGDRYVAYRRLSATGLGASRRLLATDDENTIRMAVSGTTVHVVAQKAVGTRFMVETRHRAITTGGVFGATSLVTATRPNQYATMLVDLAPLPDGRAIATWSPAHLRGALRYRTLGATSVGTTRTIDSEVPLLQVVGPRLWFGSNGGDYPMVTGLTAVDL